MNDLLADLQARDDRDMHRAIAPLAPAADAHIIDSSNMVALEAVEEVMKLWAQVRHKS